MLRHCGYTPEEKKEFLSYFCDFRADGKTSIYAAYTRAKQCMVAEGKGYPSEQAVRNWLAKGSSDEEPAAPAPAAPEPVAEAQHVTVIEDAEVPAEEVREADPEPSEEEPEAEDAEPIERVLLRLYRFRREEDIDAVVDRVLPDLKGE